MTVIYKVLCALISNELQERRRQAEEQEREEAERRARVSGGTRVCLLKYTCVLVGLLILSIFISITVVPSTLVDTLSI